jgi:type I restriction enzyme S subunit
METMDIDKAKKLVPELRFKEFDGDIKNSYKKHSFENIFLFSTGKNIKQNESSPYFEIPCVRYGELYHMYNEVISKVINKTNLDNSELKFSDGDEILLPSAGEDPLDIGSASALTIKNVAIGRTINILKPLIPDIYYQIYVAYYINQKLRKKISSLAKGVSISNVYNSDLKTLDIILPSLPEQQKIASFLSAVDEKIQQLNRKKELLEYYKKGVMQQLFSGKLRFKDEKGKDYADWGEKRLGKCLDYIQPTKYLVSSTEYDNSFNIPVLTAGKTFILGYTNETNGIFEKKLPVIIFDDFTTATKYVDFPFKAKSSAMKILVPFNEVNIKFIYEAMQIMKYEIGGHERHWISKFSQILMPFPCLVEQQKIANFLSSIDAKVEGTTQQITQTQTFKKGLLQKMFV